MTIDRTCAFLSNFIPFLSPTPLQIIFRQGQSVLQCFQGRRFLRRLRSDPTRSLLNPSVPRMQKLKIRHFNFQLIIPGLICRRNIRFWRPQLWPLGTNGLKRSVLSACSICFLKTINYKIIEVQKYLFGINGLKDELCTTLKSYKNRLLNPSAVAAAICSPSERIH